MNVPSSDIRIEQHLAKSVVVASHRRSGTHLMIDSLRLNFPQRFGRDRWGPYINLDHVNKRYGSRISLHDLYAALEQRPCIFKTHAHNLLWDFFEQDREVIALLQRLLKRRRVVYVHRDGRDTLVSLYHYARSFNDRIAEKKFSEFMRMFNDFDGDTCLRPMHRPDYWAWHVDGWIRHRDVYSVAFDQLTQDFASILMQLADRLELEQPVGLVNPVRRSRLTHWQGSYPSRLWERMRRWLPGSSRYTAIQFRTGVSGGYRTVFSDDDLQFFDRHAAGAMKMLGYYAAQDEV